MFKNKMTPAKKAKMMEILKFTGFSLSAGAIQIGSNALLVETTKLESWLCYLISLILSVLWNFTLNRKFTFKSTSNVPIAMLKVTAYYAVFAPISTWWVAALIKVGWNVYLVNILTMLINFVTEYIFCSYFVFKKKKVITETDKEI